MDGVAGGAGMDLPTPDFDSGVDTGVDPSAAAEAGTKGFADPTANTTVVPPPASWSPDPPATNLSSSDAASIPHAAGAPLTAAGAATGHAAGSGFLPMMPMMPTSGDAAKGSSRYAVPSGLVDEKELEEIDNLGPVIGGKE
jgi:hypothetical protein